MSKSTSPNAAKKYSGILSENRSENRLVEWKDDQTTQALQSWLIDRENALFDHFEITNDESQDRWRKLAFSLARKHVPAYEAVRGRPPKNIFLDQGLARKYHLLKLAPERSDTSIYDEIMRIECNVVFDAKERLKAYKKNFRAKFEADRKSVIEMIAQVGMYETSVEVENGVKLSVALHERAMFFSEQIDQWPHTEELI